MKTLNVPQMVSLLLRAYYRQRHGASEVTYLGAQDWAEGDNHSVVLRSGFDVDETAGILPLSISITEDLHRLIAESAEGPLDVEKIRTVMQSVAALLDEAGDDEESLGEASGRNFEAAPRVVGVADIGSYLVVPPAGKASGEISLVGNIAVVTGGARGFGAAISEGLRMRGARVCIADIDEAAAREQAGELNAESSPAQRLAAGPARDSAEKGSSLPDAHPFGVDVSDDSSVATLVQDVTERFGGIDVFVSNAGILRAGSVMDLDMGDFDSVTAVNYRGMFVCARHAARLMSRANHARVALGGAPSYTDIIQVNSKSGLSGSAKNGAYSGSKFGGIGLTESFALEFVDHYIKVNAVCPGNFFEGPLWSDPDTGLFVQYLRAGKVPGAESIADVRRFYEEKVPMKRGCRPEDVVHALVYLIEQQYETGQALAITGGQTMLH